MKNKRNKARQRARLKARQNAANQARVLRSEARAFDRAVSQLEAPGWMRALRLAAKVKKKHSLLALDDNNSTDASAFDDEVFGERLWAVIHRLADHSIYLAHTNHLSDRELYAVLLEVLGDEDDIEDLGPGGWSMMDLVADGSEESIEHFLRYYADVETRVQWFDDWMTDGEPLPPMETPPYDRDRHLPCLWPSVASAPHDCCVSS